MDNFYNTINKMLNVYYKEIWKGNGYIEIHSNGKVYRSLVTEHETLWICWKPYKIIHHFTDSEFNDPNAMVKFIGD